MRERRVRSARPRERCRAGAAGAILRAPTVALPGHNLLISRRASKTAAFDRTEVLQTTIGSGVAFASARWSAHGTEIWVNQSVSGVERPLVSRLR